MAFIRKRKCRGEWSGKRGDHSYQIVETYRDKGKVKQRVIVNLGHLPTLPQAIEFATKRLAFLKSELDLLKQHKAHSEKMVAGFKQHLAELEAERGEPIYLGERPPEHSGYAYAWPFTLDPEKMAERRAHLEGNKAEWLENFLAMAAGFGLAGKMDPEAAWIKHVHERTTTTVAMSVYRAGQEIERNEELTKKTKKLLADLKQAEIQFPDLAGGVGDAPSAGTDG